MQKEMQLDDWMQIARDQAMPRSEKDLRISSIQSSS
jgi:hypothetical protein